MKTLFREYILVISGNKRGMIWDQVSYLILIRSLENIIRGLSKTLKIDTLETCKKSADSQGSE